MRALLAHLLAHLRDDWNPRYYATMAAFMVGGVVACQALDVEATLIDVHHLSPLQIPIYVVFYAIPWIFGVLCHAYFHGRMASLRDPRLWLAALAALLEFAVYCHFHYYSDWIAANVDPRGRALCRVALSP